MNIEERVVHRFEELIKIGAEILQNSRTVTGYLLQTRHSYQEIDEENAFKWRMNCLQIIEKSFAKESHYYVKFEESSVHNSSIDYHQVKRSLGILKAAHNDFVNGYLFDTRVLIEAEVFDDFLEQAEELFSKGYYQPAAVIAGCVLEDGLRKLCDRNSIELNAKATIDPMNVELAKAGIYTKLRQKKITALADLRNKAAHGKWTEFAEKDVEDMIRDVQRFTEDCFS